MTTTSTDTSTDTSKDSSQTGNKKTHKRYYWLGHEGEVAQDRFFLEALDDNLWERGDSENWDTCWYTGMPDSSTFEQLDESKTINHIPGNNALTIKSYLYDTLVEAKRHALGTVNEARYQFFPQTYSMPEDYYQYLEDAIKEPDTLWIQKPKNLSRGRGIEVVQHPLTVPFEADWMIQRYIRNPHLHNGHKYVLRFYVLITSIEPLRFYLYHEGFAKLASETYDENELDNLYRHLTNPDINEENDNVDVPVTFFSFARYREWLRSDGHDDEKLFQEFNDLIALTVIAAREKMRHQVNETNADTRGCYELIGLDCMVDDNLKPWILECNLSPSLETYASGAEEASDEFTVKRQLVHDLVDMMQLNTPEPDYSAGSKAIIEQKNCGGFVQLFPGQEPNRYLQCFPVPRAKDVFSLGDNEIDCRLLNMQANENSEVVLDDSLAITTINRRGRVSFLSPNELATWIWLKNNEGLTPAQIAAELSENLPCPEGTSRDIFIKELLGQIWDTLADWGQAGAFDQATTPYNVKKVSSQWQATQYMQLDDCLLKINIACPIAAKYLVSITETFIPDSDDTYDTDINIYAGSYGYTLICGTTVVEDKLKIVELMPAILNAYFKFISTNINFSASLVALEEKHVLVVNENPLDYLDLIETLRTEVKVLSSFPYLADASACVATGRLPTISKDKPHNDQSILAQAAKIPHYLQKNTNKNNSIVALDAIIFIDKDCEVGQTLTQAKALNLLLPCFFKQDYMVSKSLSNWMTNINLIQLSPNEEVSLGSLVSNLSATRKVS